MVHFSVSLAVAAASALGVSAQNGFWRQGIDTLIKERLDPIVARAKAPSAHAHMLGGGSSLSPISTSAQLRKSKCTSSTTEGDYSLYWAPLLYFEYANGSVAEVDGGMTVYYHTSTQSAFPDDLHIVAGNPFATSYNKNDPAAYAFEWLCLDYSGSGNTRGNDWPMRNCQDGLRTQFNLPRCWDGVHLDATDHASHMAYPTDRVDGTVCPKSHPVRLPQVFYELLFGIDQFRDQWSLAKNKTWPFTWASGNKTPYGLHGDFIPAWDRALFDRANKGCGNNAAGTLDANCPGILEVNQDSGKCKVTPFIDEKVTGLLPSRPGCNPTFGPEGYKVPSCPGLATPKVLSPVVAYSGDAPPAGSCALSGSAKVVPQSSGFGYAGCVDYTGTRPFDINHGSGHTVGTCTKACRTAGSVSCGLEYGGECRSSKSKVAIPAKDSGKCNMPCNAKKSQICGGANADTTYIFGATPKLPGKCSSKTAASYNAAAPGQDTWLKTAKILTVKASKRLLRRHRSPFHH